MGQTIIEARQLWQSYGDNIVLEGVNVSVDAGEFITIVGASGCGKTTFLNLLLGTATPTRGELLLDGQPMPAEPDAQRGIVFQKYSVFPHLTALENLVLAEELAGSPVLGRLFGARRRNARKKAREKLLQVGLEHSANQYPAELSGGMQQRLAIAQALMKQPRILLLDEPFGALDPGIRNDMHELVKGLWQETGLTIFMITHDLSEAFALGSRVWVFDKVRVDPHAPHRFGARISYDLPLDKPDSREVSEAQSVNRSHSPALKIA